MKNILPLVLGFIITLFITLGLHTHAEETSSKVTITITSSSLDNALKDLEKLSNRLSAKDVQVNGTIQLTFPADALPAKDHSTGVSDAGLSSVLNIPVIYLYLSTFWAMLYYLCYTYNRKSIRHVNTFLLSVFPVGLLLHWTCGLPLGPVVFSFSGIGLLCFFCSMFRSYLDMMLLYPHTVQQRLNLAGLTIYILEVVFTIREAGEWLMRQFHG